MRRAERARAWSVAAAVAVAAAATGLLLGLGVSALSRPDDPKIGIFFFVAGAASALGALWRLGWRRHRALGDDAELARWIEGQRPHLASSLVTSAELGLRSAEAPSPLLAETMSRAAREIGALDPRRFGDPTTRGRRLIQAFGVTAVVLAAFAFAPDLWDRGWEHLSHVTPPSEDDGALWVDVAVSQLDLEVHPPAYTRQSPRRLPRGLGDVTALVGSELRFETTSLHPETTAAALVLESEPDATWALTLEEVGQSLRIRGGLKVGADDRYRFTLLLKDGTVVRERAWRRVTATPDLPPEVTLLLPETDLEVKPDDRIEFFFEASDDYGLDRVDLVALGEDGKELLRQTVREASGARVDKGSGAIDVARLDLEPGESADVYFEARDLNALARDEGPGIGKSVMRRLSLYSPAEEHERFIADLERLIERLIDVLADRLEHPIEERNPVRWSRYEPVVSGLVQTMTVLLGDLEGLIQSFSTDPLASPELREGLRESHDRLLAIHEQESARLGRWQEDPRVVNVRVLVDLLARLNDDGAVAVETSIFQLKKLLDASRKDNVMDIGRELLETQNEIMELLKQLKDTDDPALREAALKKLKKLQEKMQRLQKELAKLQERSPYENQNPRQRPSERQSEVADMKSTMDRIEELLKEGRIDEAMALMEELNRSTQEMMAGLQEDLESGGGGGGAMPNPKQAEFRQELDAIADGQRGLQGETGDVSEEMEGRLGREAREQMAEGLGQARRGAEGIREALEGARGAELHPDDRAALEGLEKKARQLEQAIDEGRLGRAGELASEIGEGLGKLRAEVGQSEAREMDEERLGGLRQSRERLDEAAEAGQRLGEQLSEMQESQQRGPNGPERQRMERLSRQQRALRERLEQLEDKLGELEQDSPGIQEELGGKLREAAEKMQEASEELGDGTPRPAESSQQQALERLREAQQAMQERMKPDQQRQGDDDGVGVNDPNARVGIPEDDPSAGPRNLREEILRAMQEDAPEEYKESIQRFYEELTR